MSRKPKEFLKNIEFDQWKRKFGSLLKKLIEDKKSASLINKEVKR